ncbi:MAG: hypothetical protein U0V56_13095 [Actinomycetota bacterium]
MKTQPRPEVRGRRFDPWTAGGYLLLALGAVGIVLGIYELGGLFALGVGFALVWVGMLVTFGGEQRRLEREEDAFRLIISGGPDG